jgi:hypothetical protein
MRLKIKGKIDEATSHYKTNDNNKKGTGRTIEAMTAFYFPKPLFKVYPNLFKGSVFLLAQVLL